MVLLTNKEKRCEPSDKPKFRIGIQMNEGVWINAKTGAWAWITEHAAWIQVASNARSLGMPEEAIPLLAALVWDFNGSGRRTILRQAMEQGFIRVRGHGALSTFESRLPPAQVIKAARPFMALNFGPEMYCRITNLESLETLEIRYADLLETLTREDLAPDRTPPCP